MIFISIAIAKDREIGIIEKINKKWGKIGYSGGEKNSIGHYSQTRSNMDLKLQILSLCILRYLEIYYKQDLSHVTHHLWTMRNNDPP